MPAAVIDRRLRLARLSAAAPRRRWTGSAAEPDPPAGGGAGCGPTRVRTQAISSGIWDDRQAEMMVCPMLPVGIDSGPITIASFSRTSSMISGVRTGSSGTAGTSAVRPLYRSSRSRRRWRGPDACDTTLQYHVMESRSSGCSSLDGLLNVTVRPKVAGKRATANAA